VKSYDLIIIGAGAAGLAAAIAFRRRCEGSALLIEAGDVAGRKILATGGGRCNLSNTAAPGWERTKEFFGSLGVLLDADVEGRAYPLTRNAASVRDALVRECESLGCSFMFGMRVSLLERGGNDDFVVRTERRSAGIRGGGDGPVASPGQSAATAMRARQVVVATGGKARPAYGNLGDGYAFARSFGIKVNTVRPSLVPFVYADDVKGGLAKLAGVRARARVRLVAAAADGDASPCAPAEARGEVQFTDYGLSGICVFDLSRYYEPACCAVAIDFAPDHTEDEISELLASGRAAGLAGVVHPKVAEYIEECVWQRRKGTVHGQKDTHEPSHSDLAATVKDFTVPIKGTKGWKAAQITSGGVAMSEVHEKYFESNSVPGLYVVGEVLDLDGPSGGYNLGYAWNTGLAAGRAAGAYCASYLTIETV
jgi:predicted flavoprotein YhiN